MIIMMTMITIFYSNFKVFVHTYIHTLPPNDRTPCAHESDKNHPFPFLVKLSRSKLDKWPVIWRMPDGQKVDPVEWEPSSCFSFSLLAPCRALSAGSSSLRFRWFRRQEWKGLPSVPTPHASRWIMEIKLLVMTQRCQEGCQCQGHAMHTCSFQNIRKEHIFLS